MTYYVLATQQGGAELMKDKCPTVTASAGMSGNNQPVVFIPERERERAVVYGIDRAAFNCGANARFDFPITEEVSTVLRARGPNAVAVPRRRNESIHDEDKTRM